MRLCLVLLLVACGDDKSTSMPIDAAPTVDAPPDAPVTLNGCTLATATDLSAPGAMRAITISDDLFTPKCMRIAAGQSVTWNGDFSNHPLAPGRLLGGQVQAQPGNPVPMVNTGTTVNVAFPAAGEWAYYCPNHAPGMAGAVYVQ